MPRYNILSSRGICTADGEGSHTNSATMGRALLSFPKPLFGCVAFNGHDT